MADRLTEHTPSPRVTAQIERAFGGGGTRALNADQRTRMEIIGQRAYGLATEIAKLAPESREQSLALTALEEAVMFANAAIARENG